ncbi:TcpE family conjugal transfer membrane protein [Spirillospora sp. NPDC047418]
MDLPTYTNIWRIEKRLYKLYDLRLPMPLPLVQIGVFLGVFVPWILLLRLVGIPFESPWHVLYIVPPGFLTWMATRPVIEGKRLTELLLSHSRYLAEPRTWCRLTPIREPREVVIVARVWRRAEAPAAMERAAVKAHRKRRREPAPTPLPARLPRPAAAAAPPPLADYAAQAAAAPPKPWRRSTRDISHEDDVLPVPAEAERPPATPRLETAAGSGKRALASGVRRPGAPAEFWQAAPATRPDIPQQNPAAIRRAAEEIANAPADPRQASAQPPPAWANPPAAQPPGDPSAAQAPGHAPPSQVPGPAPSRPQQAGSPATPARPPTPQKPADPSDVRVAGRAPAPGSQEAPTHTPAASTERPAPATAAEATQEPRTPAAGDPSVVWAPGQASASRGPDTPPEQQQQANAQPPPTAQTPGNTPEAGAAGQAPAPGSPAERPAAAASAPAQQDARERSQQVSAQSSPTAQTPGDAPDVRVAGQASVPGSQAGQPAAAASAPAEQDARERSQQVSAQPPPTAQTPGGAPDVRGAGQASAPGSQAGQPAAAASGPAEAGRERRVPGVGDSSDVRVAGRKAVGAQGESQQGEGRRPGEATPQVRVPAAERPATERTAGNAVPPVSGAGGAASGEAGDRRVAGPPVPPPWAPPPATRPDVPVVPGAFGAQGGQPPAPRREPPKPWSEGLSRPMRPAAEGAAAPPAPPTPVPEPAPPVEEQAPPREVRSQPASPVRPRPLPPPPAPPPSGPAITPPGPEHEVTSGGLRRLIHAVGGGHGEVDAEYQQRLQQPFHGTRHVVVLGCTGGAGQTVTALMLGHTFAQHNGEPVVAIDVNPGPGALARRTRSDTNETLTGLITRADQVGSLTAMRRYTSQAKSGLDVIAAGKNPLQALDDRDYALAIRTIDRFYSVTLLDAAAAVVARVLPYADQIVLVAPASADAPRAVAMTFEWLDGHGYEELRSRAVTVINGVSRRSMDDVEQAEAVARGRCRALVRIPWDDHLSMDRAPRNELKSLRTPTRRAYLALAGVVAGGFTVMPERYQELQQEQEATR